MKKLVFISEQDGKEFYPEGMTESEMVDAFNEYKSGAAEYLTEAGGPVRLEIRELS